MLYTEVCCLVALMLMRCMQLYTLYHDVCCIPTYAASASDIYYLSSDAATCMRFVSVTPRFRFK